MMIKPAISNGTIHKLPQDFKDKLRINPKALAAWENITPLARNEWICWIVSVKQQKTRDVHIKRAVSELKEGKRRPCCWIGCSHRPDKPVSPSQKWFLSNSKS